MSGADQAALSARDRQGDPRTEWACVLIVAVAILASVWSSLLHRQRHYQELDSYAVAAFFDNPLGDTIRYTLSSYRPSKWGGQADVDPASTRLIAILNRIPDTLLGELARSGQLARLGIPSSSTAPAIRSALAQRLEADPNLKALPLHGIYRLGIVSVVGSLHLPKALEGAALFALASTYSPGPGLLYAGIAAVTAGPQAMMNLAVALTIFVFHFGVVIQFLMLRRLGFGPFASAAAAIWYLFATTHYLYGMHLGSTVWVMASSSIFLWFAAGALSGRTVPRRVSFAAGVLVFFNYLVALYYLAFLMWDFLRRLGAGGPGAHVARVRAVVGGMVAAHWSGLALILLCVLLFFQPGQGVRGAMETWGEMPVYLTHGLANLFGFSAGPYGLSPLAIAVQAAVAAAVLAVGTFAMGRGARAGDPIARAVGVFLLCLAAVYGVLLAMGALSFTPTRHALFLAPAAFILIAYGIAAISRRFSQRPALAVGTLVLLAAAGFAAQWVQLGHMKSAFPKDPPRIAPNGEPYVAAIGLGYPVAWSLGLPIVTPNRLTSLKGPILFADQDCDEACVRYHISGLAEAAGFAVNIIPVGTYASPVRANPFVPSIEDGRFAFDRWNRIYLSAIIFTPLPKPPATGG